MKSWNVAGLFALGFVVSGCATIVDGSTQSVSVASTPVDGAMCSLTNSQGTWYVTTPGSATVHKTKTDLSVHCTKSGYQDADMVANAKFGGTTFANVLAGGLVGVAVDAASGANYHYDSPLNITLTPVAPAPTAATTPADAKGPGV